MPTDRDAAHGSGAASAFLEAAGGHADDGRGEGSRRAAWVRIALVAGGSAALALAWAVTPLGAWLTPERVASWVTALRASPFAPLVVMVGFVLATMIMVPVNLMILGTGLAFGPALGIPYAMLGVLASASAQFAVGRALGRRAVQRAAGERVERAVRALERSGILAVAVARVVPVAPFGLVNMAAGASSLRFRTFLLGTAVGNGASVLLLVTLGTGAVRLAKSGDPRWLAALAVALLLGLGLALAVRRVRGTQVS